MRLRKKWEKLRKGEEEGMKIFESLMHELRWFLVKEEFQKDRKDKSWQFSRYNNRVWPRSTGRFEARKVSSEVDRIAPRKLNRWQIHGFEERRLLPRDTRPTTFRDIVIHTDSRHSCSRFCSRNRESPSPLSIHSEIPKLRSENENFTSQLFIPRDREKSKIT